MTPLSLIPLSWKIGAAVAMAGAMVAGGAAYHHHVYQQGFDAAVAQRAARDAVAVVARVQDNAALSVKQADTNINITKAKNEELAPIVRRIVAERVRVGPAICGPSTPTQAASAAGSDRADPPGRLVRDDVERDLRALKLAVEQDLATGRACQAFIKENGFTP